MLFMCEKFVSWNSSMASMTSKPEIVCVCACVYACVRVCVCQVVIFSSLLIEVIWEEVACVSLTDFDRRDAGRIYCKGSVFVCMCEKI